jgi:hypothetical protein
MTGTVAGACRRAWCAKIIPSSLETEQLCLDHFLDEAAVRTSDALERSRESQPIDSKGFEGLLADALAIVKNLEEGAGEPNPEQRNRMLELLLSLANLHEYVAHVSIRLGHPA